MIAVPDYDDVAAELGDPELVLDELNEALAVDPPRLTDALSATDEEIHA